MTAATGLVVALRALADDVETTATRFTTDIERLAGRLDQALEGVAEITGEIREIAPRDCRLEMSAERLLIRWQGKDVPRVPRRAFDIVAYLSRRPGVVRERGEIIDACWPANVDLAPVSVDGEIKRIRAKFLVVDSHFRAIETVYGVGYTWRLGP